MRWRARRSSCCAVRRRSRVMRSMAMMYAHLSEPPPSLSSRRAGTRLGLMGCWPGAGQGPAGRFGSCREFADALRGAFGLAAYHDVYETGPAPGRRPGPVANGSAAAGNGAAAGSLTQSGGPRGPREQGAPGYSEEVTGSWPVTQHRAGTRGPRTARPVGAAPEPGRGARGRPRDRGAAGCRAQACRYPQDRARADRRRRCRAGRRRMGLHPPQHAPPQHPRPPPPQTRRHPHLDQAHS